MSLFQTSVLKNYIKGLDIELIDTKYKEFINYFGNPEIQQNIRDSKEEEYQSGFVRALFVNILGYTLKPEPNYNFVLEKKNVDDSKKADGAILKNNEVIAVIELKSTQTTDLDTIETQAFGYKNHNPKCQYIITSNFEKIRLYIQNAIDHIEFNLFNLTKEDFALLWLCLVKDNILQDIPLKIKESSVLQEENVTKQLYNDYSKFRKEIFADIVKNNPEFDKLVLFKKTQKLLDRFLFIFFAEDRLLLPPNSISEIVKQWTTLKEDLDEYVPLYERFKKYFGYLNTGFKGKKYDIFAYNGGLFLPDEILDNIKISDEVLHQNTIQLSKYDFETDVDVNILGHIFEHSLSEIENVQAEIAGEVIDKQKTKRKKDGIFYTPKYITKYIVENTVGKLCNEKRSKLGIIDEEYAKGRRKRKKEIVKDLDNKLTAYRNWLLEITILDPACGSGAFLNQALEFLIQEHKKIDELKAQLLGGSIVFPDIESKILEKNIFGVDLNEESVEIAKLSLWLRTAQKGRKLTILSNNIKCGNSLIDDPVVAGEKAFNWQNEFSEVFEKGGFDVVIGNPPYVRLQGLKANYEKESIFYEKSYKSATANYDIYALFIEKGFKLINRKGNVCFIQPHKFLISDFGIGIRGYLLEHKAVESILHFGSNMVFKDASTYTCVLKLSYNNNNIDFKHIEPEKIEFIANFDTISYNKLTAENWNLTNNAITKVLDKLKQQPLTVKDVFIKIFVGLQTSGDKVYLIKGGEEGNYIVGYSQQLDKVVTIEKGLVKPMLKGEDVSKYKNLDNQYWVIFPYLLEGGKAEVMTEDYIQQNFPKGYDYLKKNEEFLRGREKGKMDKAGWFLYIYPKSLAEFEQEKISTPDISLGSNMTLDSGVYYHGTTLYSFIKKDTVKEDYKFFLSIFNSSLLWFFIKNTGTELRGGYFRFKTNYLNPFPLPKSGNLEEQQLFIKNADKMLKLNKQLQEKKSNFINRIKDNFEIEKTNKKLDTFYDFDFKTFVSELRKQKVSLSLVQQDEWSEYFNTYKTEINNLQSEINQIDRTIDQMVYELYGLTEEEIKIVEESVK